MRNRALSFVVAVCACTASVAANLPWLESEASRTQALGAIAVLEAAGDQGLDPADYDAAGLRGQFGKPGFEDALTQSLLRYLHDMRLGRIDPKQVGAQFDLPRAKPTDGEKLLRDAMSAQRVAAALREAQPQLPMYDALRMQLAHYRELASDPAWRQRLPALPHRKVSPGDSYDGVQLLAKRLHALGDLPLNANAIAGDNRYEGAVVDAVRSFQERHGLAADGVIGTATWQQLEVAPAARALQIALAMERLRWTPFMQGPRMVVINVPEFVLRAYEVNGAHIDVRLTSRVVVGKAVGTRTPLFGAPMRFIEFSPYWNVPPSIASKETAPRLRRDPAYFEREGFEFVAPSGEVMRTLTAANLDAVLRGGWRIRQRPGPLNALGGIKFVFPNHDNIYLHHTPATELFERDRRDFSHGCIRVQMPVELAQFGLKDEPGPDAGAWTESRIRDEMASGESKTLALHRPLAVLIAYSTVIVKQGKVFFFADVYGHDARLARALKDAQGNFRAAK